MRDQVVDGRVELTTEGEQLPPPTLFSPDRVEVGVSGYSASLGYDIKRWSTPASTTGSGAKTVEWHQKATRSVYDINEIRHWTQFGLGAIVKPGAAVDVGIAARPRVLVRSADLPLLPLRRLERRTDDGARQPARERRPPRLPPPPGAGGPARSCRSRSAAPTGSGTSRASRIRWRRRRTTTTTSCRPRRGGHPRWPRSWSRPCAATRGRLGWGLGGSYRFLQQRGVAGLEYEWNRAATDGTEYQTRAETWQVRAGGQYDFSPGWGALGGYRHTGRDADTYTRAQRDDGRPRLDRRRWPGGCSPAGRSRRSSTRSGSGPTTRTRASWAGRARGSACSLGRSF